MKRKILFLIIIVLFSTVSFAQRRTRNSIQKIIQLTEPQTTGGMPFQEALSKAKNVPVFTGEPIDRTTIGQLAWAGLGNKQTPDTFVATPAPGESLFPSQLYFITSEGVFFYQPINHSLEQIYEGDTRMALANTTTMPNSVVSAGCVIVVTSSVTSSRSSTRRTTTSSSTDIDRASMLLEAGHIAQNIQLQAVSLDKGLGTNVISNFDSRAVNTACNLPRELDALYLICVGYMTEEANNPTVSAQKKAAIIVPAQNFDDVEFFTTLSTLTAAKIQTVVASNRTGMIVGMNGGTFQVGMPIQQLRVLDYDSIVVIGGSGATIFINDLLMVNIIREAFNNRKIIGATSMGTSVLASAQILQGIKVTGIATEAGNIQQMGAIFSNIPVEEDKRIITCAGPQAARLFSTALADAILGK